ncbi:Peptidoglycan glycosyltransferase [Actinobacteria bacterium OK074]|nr:Peptidoglycan glycosyltransferase [Actinobacteria bacterium OK074]
MGRAEERKARQRGGRRAEPQRSSEAPSGSAYESSSGAPAEPPSDSGGTAASLDAGGPTVIGGRAAARKAAAKAAKKKDKNFFRRLFTWKKILGATLGGILLVMGAFVVMYLMIDVPEGNAAARQQSNVYKYSDGSLLTRDGTVNRELVDLAQVPKPVQHTFVAAENKTFYTDSGIDLKGTTRGILNTLMGRGTQGGSTITQQYVKNYYLTQEQTVTRKLKEIVISLKVDQKVSKDDILAGYINTSYYGRGAYGIQAAAQAYYRVDAKDLSVEQGAYLAALLQAPSQYDWAVATPTGKKLVQARWNYVLDNMVGQKWLDATKRAAMTFPVPKDPKVSQGMEGQTGYLVTAADAELEKQLVSQGTASDTDEAKAMVDAGGWTITLNIDKKKEAALEKSVKQQLTSKLDAKKRKVDGNVQPGAVSVNPKTGAVVAMYGGVDYLKHYTNNATRSDYQPASTFKPVILAAAIDENAKTQDGEPITWNTIYDGTSKRPVVGSAIGFAPENEDDHDYGKITVQTAMNDSVNSVFAQLGVDVGMDNVLKTAKLLGMDTDGLAAVPAQTLGTMGASPLTMAGIYATLDNHGVQVTPTMLKSVTNKDHQVTLPDPIGKQVITREAADTVTSVLTGVVDDGTAKVSVKDNPNRNGQAVAGKTGTSDNNKSAWFTGYTPNLVTSVGLFGEDAKTRVQTTLTGATGLIAAPGRINGGGYPAQIWAQYTFGVQGSTAVKFDLDTKQGAAVQPTASPTPSLSPSPTPSATPSETPTTTEPSETPTTPSETPTTPTTGATTPTTSTTTPGSDTVGNTGGDPFDPNST